MSFRILTIANGLLLSLLVAPLLQDAQAADEASQHELKLTSSDRDHWSFTPLSKAKAPHVSDTDWPRNDIDNFILKKLRSKKLSPAPQADRVTLIRRVTFDLTGLPATPEEVDQFVADKSENAYEKVIDRLLASEAYGERWAQHWLDLARYAESDGFEHDKVRPKAWKYRDWVIKSLNEDMPYGEFVRMQIAGDLISPDDPEAAIATGFTLAGPDMPDINLLEERRHTILNDITGTVGSVFLGLQVGCAACHDHVADPVSQADFYRFRAFFENSLSLEENCQPGQSKMMVKVDGEEKVTSKYADRTLRERPASEETQFASFVHVRGEFNRTSYEVKASFPRIAVDEKQKQQPENGTRVDLANWLARKDNHLATRTIVNRLWQTHFGQGIVSTSSDFGVLGEKPSHPELLDWLARELGRQQGSLKAMHKLMMMSATYRQSSHFEGNGSDDLTENWEKGSKIDPANELLWRANRKRLEGEIIRDSILFASGRLSSLKGGPGVMPPLPEELVSTLLKNQWNVSENEEDHRRRSVYLFARRNLRYPIFEVFDRPAPDQSCAKRSRSTIAPQSLLLLNSDFCMESAQTIARDLLKNNPKDQVAQIQSLYRRTLSREPTKEEIASAVSFLNERIASLKEQNTPAEKDASPNHEAQALTYLSLAMFNLNEFVYVD